MQAVSNKTDCNAGENLMEPDTKDACINGVPKQRNGDDSWQKSKQ